MFYYFNSQRSITCFWSNDFAVDDIHKWLDSWTCNSESRSVKSAKHFSASSTDSTTLKSYQVGTKWDTFLSWHYTMQILPCCSIILCIISTCDHCVTTSPFNFFPGKFFCHWVSCNSSCLFQLPYSTKRSRAKIFADFTVFAWTANVFLWISKCFCTCGPCLMQMWKFFH